MSCGFRNGSSGNGADKSAVCSWSRHTLWIALWGNAERICEPNFIEAPSKGIVIAFVIAFKNKNIGGTPCTSWSSHSSLNRLSITIQGYVECFLHHTEPWPDEQHYRVIWKIIPMCLCIITSPHAPQWLICNHNTGMVAMPVISLVSIKHIKLLAAVSLHGN